MVEIVKRVAGSIKAKVKPGNRLVSSKNGNESNPYKIMAKWRKEKDIKERLDRNKVNFDFDYLISIVLIYIFFRN